MRLVLDTNIVLKALIRDSKVKAILLSPNHRFFLPEYAIEETKRHIDLIRRKTGLHENEVTLILDVLLTGIVVVNSKSISTKWKQAERITGRIDRGDIPFIATALSLPCDGIWSDDEHFKRQNRVKVYSTRDIIRHD